MPRKLIIAVAALLSFSMFAMLVVWTQKQRVGTRARAIQSGMSTQQVRDIMGEPDRISSSDTWDYDAELRMGWVQVSFDKNGRVTGVSDETAYPW